MPTLSKTAALAKARRMVVMQRIGRDWQVNTWSEERKAWWQGTSEPYAKAKGTYAQCIAATALELMGMDGIEAASHAYYRASCGAPTIAEMMA